MPLRIRRDSETSSSDSWSIVDDDHQNVDVLRDSDDDSDVSYSDSEMDSDVEQVFDEEEEVDEGKEDDRQDQHVEPIVEEPMTEDEEEEEEEQKKEEEEDDYMSSEHSDLEIQETQDEEDEELSILEIREKPQHCDCSAAAEPSSAPFLIALTILTVSYMIGAILFHPPAVYHFHTSDEDFARLSYRVSNVSLPTSPVRKPIVVLDGPVPPVSVCMPSKPRNLSVSRLVRPKPTKSFFSKYQRKYSAKLRGETRQVTKPASFSKSKDLSPLYNLRSSARTTRKAARPSPATHTQPKTTKYLPSVIYEQNTTRWNLKSKRDRVQKAKKIQNSRKASQLMRPKKQHVISRQCQGGQFTKYTKKRIGYKAPLPCHVAEHKPSEPKRERAPSFDWIQRRAQIRKALREMF